MRRVEMIMNGSGTKGIAELNHHTRYEQKETRDGITGEGQMLSEEDESRINESVGDMDDGNLESLHVAPVVIHRPQKQLLVPVVRWERFLHVRTLKVLLVENDNSTRQVVSALLRNCSYEVTAVANGLQAWAILTDVRNHIDLVLTEVVMPVLSGLGLLSKIMSHQTCKNIPVIMMSSHDSMGIVFKCLSKGAVDFLVKPIRKNELKNLWQHVWRKCHSSSGSGSESGVRAQKSAKTEESDKNGSNDQDDSRSIGLNARDGSDHGSGTQSSWTKCAIEVDSPQSFSQWNQLTDDPPDSTCGQVNYPRAEELCNNLESMTPTRKCQQQNDVIDNAAMGKHLTIGVHNPSQQDEGPREMTVNNNTHSRKHKVFDVRFSKHFGKFEEGQVEPNGEKPTDNLSSEDVVLMEVTTNNSDPKMESSKFEISNGSENKDKTSYETIEMPSLELSLKSHREIGVNGTSAHEQNIWRHSNHSAFSRYNSFPAADLTPTGNMSSYSPLDNSLEAIQNLTSNNFDGTPPNQNSNGSSVNNDMGSTTNNDFDDNSAPNITVKVVTPSLAFQQGQNGYISSPLPNLTTHADDVAHAGDKQKQVQVHQHYHHHHQHVHKSSHKEQKTNHDNLSLNKMVVGSLPCGSSNVWKLPVNKASNNSLNGSASGSNHGCSGHYGNSIVGNEGVTFMENGDISVGANGGASGSRSITGIDESQSARRVAALNKFRLKRKDRCFEKKVRYHSRKRLAEQRPRVRGQFVRQAAQENKSNDADS